MAFSWYVPEHKDEEINIKMKFDYPPLISASGAGSEIIEFKVKDKEYFKSPKTNFTIDTDEYD